MVELVAQDGQMPATSEGVHVGGATLSYTRETTPGAVAWSELGVDVVLECSDRFRSRETLEAYFEQGVKKVIVAAPTPPALAR